jgi:hypothetical protein
LDNHVDPLSFERFLIKVDENSNKKFKTSFSLRNYIKVKQFNIITYFILHSKILKILGCDIIPVSSGRKDGSCSATKRAAHEEAQGKGPEEAEVTSADKAEATANDAIVFPANFGDPSDSMLCPRRTPPSSSTNLQRRRNGSSRKIF